MLEFRFNLASETGLILSLLGVVLSVISILYVAQKKQTRVIISVCTILFSILVTLNYFSMSDYIKIPDVTGRTRDFAKDALIDVGIDAENILIVANSQSISADNLVISQAPQAGTVAHKTSSVTLNFATENKVVASEENITVGTITHIPSVNGLSLQIDDCIIKSDGYFYQSAEDWYIHMNGLCITGTFHYSTELSDKQIADWGHGGKILDAYGNDYSKDAEFFSDYNGNYAVKIPEAMATGNYTYVLYQFIENEYCEVRIPFTIQ